MKGLLVFSNEVELAIVLTVFVTLCAWLYLAESSR